MTVDATGSGTAVEPYEAYEDIGLEDVDASDLVIPRLLIDHKKGVFVNNLSKEEFPALTVVILGLVKQRILWPEKLDEGDKPMCKSPDFVHGFPRWGEGIPKTKQFPWAKSNFDPANAIPIEEEPSRKYPNGWDSHGYPTLPCDSCVFTQWGKDEDNKSVPPPCSEQHTYPLRYYTADGDWVTALFTIQRSAIKNSKTYINSFAQIKQPMFTVYTELSLRQESKAGNEFSIPEFKRGVQSDRNAWEEYGQLLRSLREFVRQAPRRQDDEEQPEPSNNDNTGPDNTVQGQVVEEPPAPTPPAPPTPQATEPAAQPAAAAPPAPPTAAPPQPAPTQPAPAAAAPPAPPAPPRPPAPPAPVPAAAPAAATPTQGEESPSDLPF